MTGQISNNVNLQLPCFFMSAAFNHCILNNGPVTEYLVDDRQISYRIGSIDEIAAYDYFSRNITCFNANVLNIVSTCMENVNIYYVIAT